MPEKQHFKGFKFLKKLKFPHDKIRAAKDALCACYEGYTTISIKSEVLRFTRKILTIRSDLTLSCIWHYNVSN